MGSISTAQLSRKNLSEETTGDALHVISACLADWPYTRAVDDALLAHWRTLAQYQPHNIWVAYAGGEPVAFAHGEIDDKQCAVHLLALVPGAAQAGSWLLGCLEGDAREQGVADLVSPNWRSGIFYGGYTLGCEPYHPHWAVDGTEAYVRAGFRISLAGVIMVRDLADPLQVGATHCDYRIVPCPDREEFDATPFGYHALYNGEKVAHCYARLYPNLKSPSGKIIGQIGNVATDPDHRGRRLARVMTQMCLRDLQAMGAGEALIATGLDNAPALRAYENAGFERRYNINEWSKELRLISNAGITTSQ